MTGCQLSGCDGEGLKEVVESDGDLADGVAAAWLEVRRVGECGGCRCDERHLDGVLGLLDIAREIRGEDVEGR